MICTFGDVTDVDLVARAGAAGARRSSSRTARSSRSTWGERGLGVDRCRRARSRHYDQLAGLSAAKARAQDRRAAARERRSHRRAAADHPRGEVLREGGSPARDRDEPPVVHQDDGLPRGAARARTRAAVAPAVHAGAARELDQRAERRLVRQPPAVLRRAVSALVPGPRRRHRRLRARGCCRAEDRLPIDPSTDVPEGYRAGPARTSPAASPAIPTSWTRGRPRRSRRRLPAAGKRIPTCSRASSRWTCGRRRTTSSARGCSRRCCGRSSSSARCRGATRRSPAGCSIRTARRCRSRRGTSSRRWACSRSTAPTACATGRRAAGRAPTRPSTRAR